MWYDKCLLIFPLRGGAIAWSVWVAAYSIAGGIFLLIEGQYLFFNYPEWQIYGGFGLCVALTAIISMLALYNQSYLWTQVSKTLWPFMIILSNVRAIFMIVELQRGKDKFIWECEHGGQLWPSSSTSSSSVALPSGFCVMGFGSLNIAFIISLLVDVIFQIYMCFLVWRYSQQNNYSSMKGPFSGGYYQTNTSQGQRSKNTYPFAH